MLEYFDDTSLGLHRVFKQELEQWFDCPAVNFYDEISLWLYDELTEKHQESIAFEDFHSQLLALRDANPDPDQFMTIAHSLLWETIGYLENWMTEETVRKAFQKDERLRAIYRERL